MDSFSLILNGVFKASHHERILGRRMKTSTQEQNQLITSHLKENKLLSKLSLNVN